MLSALSNIFAAVLAVSVPGTSIGRGFNARPLEQLLREPRRIEILDQVKIVHFQSDVANYRWTKLRFHTLISETLTSPAGQLTVAGFRLGKRSHSLTPN
jgi:hypothetical protein